MPIIQPNEMPLIGLPLGLSDEAAAELIDFLYALTEALERHYCGQLLRYAHRNDPGSSRPDGDPGGQPSPETDDPPF